MTVPYPPVTGEEPCTKRPELYYSEDKNHEEMRAAKNMCKGCPVLAECAAYGIHHELYGVWGSLGPHDRRDIRKARGIMLDQPTTRLERREPIKHGTEAGFKQHQRRGEPVNAFDSCGCRRAMTRAGAERKERMRREQAS